MGAHSRALAGDLPGRPAAVGASPGAPTPTVARAGPAASFQQTLAARAVARTGFSGSPISSATVGPAPGASLAVLSWPRGWHPAGPAAQHLLFLFPWESQPRPTPVSAAVAVSITLVDCCFLPQPLRRLRGFRSTSEPCCPTSHPAADERGRRQHGGPSAIPGELRVSSVCESSRPLSVARHSALTETTAAVGLGVATERPWLQRLG